MRKNNKPLIIGVCGAFGSGKSTAAAFFELKGFKKIILSGFLEKEADKRGIKKVTRKVLQDIGNEWREKYGRAILAKKTIEEILKGNFDKVVIDGIRNVGEIEYLQKVSDFTLVAVILDRKVRFKRLEKLKKRESLTWELFKKLDSRDSGLNEKETGLHVDKCIAMADYSIENNGSEEEFKNKLEKLLNKL